MGLFDGYFDPEQFGEGGGLLGRLLALQQQRGQYQPGGGFDQTQFVPPPPDPASRWGSGNANGVPHGAGSPVMSDLSPDPVRPGSHYAQAPLALCATGPVGCAAGAGLTAAQAILGGAALGGLGAVILNNGGASRPPAGSRPINETPWSGDHREIKKAANAGSTDNVTISPTGDVWAQSPDGSWTNHGPVDIFTGSGKPSGRRGKDRDQWR
jgi:hypothetical protein